MVQDGEPNKDYNFCLGPTTVDGFLALVIYYSLVLATLNLLANI
ncbi:MAG: hypothetical protein ACPKPY_07765 [Nitrososphaeraceae archaeon]